MFPSDNPQQSGGTDLPRPSQDESPVSDISDSSYQQQENYVISSEVPIPEFVEQIFDGTEGVHMLVPAPQVVHSQPNTQQNSPNQAVNCHLSPTADANPIFQHQPHNVHTMVPHPQYVPFQHRTQQTVFNQTMYSHTGTPMAPNLTYQQLPSNQPNITQQGGYRSNASGNTCFPPTTRTPSSAETVCGVIPATSFGAAAEERDLNALRQLAPREACGIVVGTEWYIPFDNNELNYAYQIRAPPSRPVPATNVPSFLSPIDFNQFVPQQFTHNAMRPSQVQGASEMKASRKNLADLLESGETPANINSLCSPLKNIELDPKPIPKSEVYCDHEQVYRLPNRQFAVDMIHFLRVIIDGELVFCMGPFVDEHTMLNIDVQKPTDRRKCDYPPTVRDIHVFTIQSGKLLQSKAVQQMELAVKMVFWRDRMIEIVDVIKLIRRVPQNEIDNLKKRMRLIPTSDKPTSSSRNDLKKYAVTVPFHVDDFEAKIRMRCSTTFRQTRRRRYSSSPCKRITRFGLELELPQMEEQTGPADNSAYKNGDNQKKKSADDERANTLDTTGMDHRKIQTKESSISVDTPVGGNNVESSKQNLVAPSGKDDSTLADENEIAKTTNKTTISDSKNASPGNNSSVINPTESTADDGHSLKNIDQLELKKLQHERIKRQLAHTAQLKVKSRLEEEARREADRQREKEKVRLQKEQEVKVRLEKESKEKALKKEAAKKKKAKKSSKPNTPVKKVDEEMADLERALRESHMKSEKFAEALTEYLKDKSVTWSEYLSYPTEEASSTFSEIEQYLMTNCSPNVLYVIRKGRHGNIQTMLLETRKRFEGGDEETSRLIKLFETLTKYSDHLSAKIIAIQFSALLDEKLLRKLCSQLFDEIDSYIYIDIHPKRDLIKVDDVVGRELLEDKYVDNFVTYLNRTYRSRYGIPVPEDKAYRDKDENRMSISDKLKKIYLSEHEIACMIESRKRNYCPQSAGIRRSLWSFIELQKSALIYEDMLLFYYNLNLLQASEFKDEMFDILDRELLSFLFEYYQPKNV